MGKPGKKIDDYYTKEQVIEIFHEYGGVIKDVAKHIGVSRPTLYNYLDIHPDVKQAQELADSRLDRHVVETAYEGVDKLLENIEEDPGNAFKAINLVLSKSKHSRYFEKKEDTQSLPTNIKAIYFGEKAADDANERNKNS